MPAPTALQRGPEIFAEEAADTSLDSQEIVEGQGTRDVEIITSEPFSDSQLSMAQVEDSEDTTMQIDAEGRPHFAPSSESISSTAALKVQSRKVPIPPHRMTPLKSSWPKIYPPLVEHLKLQVRMNIKSRAVEIRTSKFTTDPGALQRGEDFLRAFCLGFDVDDAIALIRLDSLYIESLEIKDFRNLQGEHLSRAIGRIAGKDGKTKFAIENTSRTRIVLADNKIHILGSYENIAIARTAVASLVLGSPPGKVYGNLRTVASRMKERF